LRRRRRTTHRRDFVPWRFSTAGRWRTPRIHRHRRLKTYTQAEISSAPLLLAAGLI
jgi:hypothetical protein